MAAVTASSPGGGGGDALTTCTWNIAAVNNNPLEYWTTYDSPGYMQLMVDVERMIDNPGDRDVPLGTIFPAFEDLTTRMAAVEGLNEGVDEVRAIWESDLSKRSLVSGFLKDKAIGSKRFISMPDRFTNTINLASSSEPNCRPAVTNNYVGDLGSFDAWWAAWAAFMFDTELFVPTRSGPAFRLPCKLLSKISRAKYPALSEEEERVSLPMQVLCLALFDCALVHIMNTLSPSGEWLTIKRRLCDALFVNKQARTLEILSGPAYASCDVIFLQEVAGNFVAKLQESPLGTSHHVLPPAKLDSARDQNSVVLLKKSTFPDTAAGGAGSGAFLEVSDDVRATLGGDAGVMDGDIMVVRAADAAGRPYVLATFHGDTEGLQSPGVLEALHATVGRMDGAPSLLFGLDANVYEQPSTGKKPHLHYLEWVAKYEALGLASNWGPPYGSADAEAEAGFDPVACRTTFNARTFLQPQLQKAVRLDDFKAEGDCNPKDYLLFPAGDFAVTATRIDNTGEGGVPGSAPYAETPIPSLVWPSDHMAVLTTLQRR